MKPSQLITGTILTIAGIALIFISLLFTEFIIIYGIIALILGIVILLNKSEDKIEQIKWKK